MSTLIKRTKVKGYNKTHTFEIEESTMAGHTFCYLKKNGNYSQTLERGLLTFQSIQIKYTEKLRPLLPNRPCVVFFAVAIVYRFSVRILLLIHPLRVGRPLPGPIHPEQQAITFETQERKYLPATLHREFYKRQVHYL